MEEARTNYQETFQTLNFDVNKRCMKFHYVWTLLQKPRRIVRNYLI